MSGLAIPRAMQPADARAITTAGRRRSAQQLPRRFASADSLSWEEMLGAPVRAPRQSLLDAEVRATSARIQAGLGALGIRSVGQLLEHLPRDRRLMRPIAELRAGEQATVAAEVCKIISRPMIRRGRRAGAARGPRSVAEARIRDESGAIGAVFFNQPWLVRRYAPGTRLLLHGKVDARRRLQVWSHALEAAPPTEPSPAASDGQDGGGTPPPSGCAGWDAEPTGGDGRAAIEQADSIPHYPAADGVTSTQLAALVRRARPSLAEVVEPLPARLRALEGFPDRAGALGALHFSRLDGESELARRRLAFEELLLTQLVFLRRRARRRAQLPAPALDGARARTTRWLERGLPFALTDDQLAAIREIDRDLAAGSPMQRLLIGEVGAGKTVVALHAMLRAAEHGHQSALMAPTETLAEQHLATLRRLLSAEEIGVALLSGSTSARARRRALAELAAGATSIVVGTHALIEPDVRFRSLALAVVDEQHRFGVRQRVALEGKAPHGLRPHVLHMTATPIPRTLALAGYGDLDVSTLVQLPSGRKAVQTKIVADAAARGRAYAALREQLTAGRQAYVVCPLVEQPEEDGGPDHPACLGADVAARAATAELEQLRCGELAGFRLALLHGQMPAKEKQAAMAAFAAGEADALVATTVIEVGLDVPNATVMLVENAERFGISQLHQLRGRIGRGEHRSTCFLMCSAGPSGSGRLRALAQHADGFRLAEIDLALRGRGELVGTRQSGHDLMRVARLPADGDLLERARHQAEAIAARDPELMAPEHTLLGHALERTFGADALAPIPA
jgi:ATP-dependent DNA helicase RecG